MANVVLKARDLDGYLTDGERKKAGESLGLLVGDLSQPRGGPAAFGHASHQSGLDVDIWFRLLPKDAELLSRQQTEQLAMASVIRASEGVLDKQRWDRRYGDLLRLAASAPEVDRIFVNPLIKQALCRSGEGGAWLGKLRPWWGHDQHFHVRLACPADSQGCEPQKPIPAGDGCDEDLDGWIREIQLATKRPKPTPPDRSATRLPSACEAVLAAAPSRADSRTTLGAAPAKADKRRLAGKDLPSVRDRN